MKKKSFSIVATTLGILLNIVIFGLFGLKITSYCLGLFSECDLNYYDLFKNYENFNSWFLIMIILSVVLACLLVIYLFFIVLTKKFKVLKVTLSAIICILSFGLSILYFCTAPILDSSALISGTLQVTPLAYVIGGLYLFGSILEGFELFKWVNQ